MLKTYIIYLYNFYDKGVEIMLDTSSNTKIEQITNTETLEAIEEVKILKEDSHRKIYYSFTELLQDLNNE